MDSFQGEVPAQSWRGLIISDGSSFMSQGDEGDLSRAVQRKGSGLDL